MLLDKQYFTNVTVNQKDIYWLEPDRIDVLVVPAQDVVSNDRKVFEML